MKTKLGDPSDHTNSDTNQPYPQYGSPAKRGGLTAPQLANPYSADPQPVSYPSTPVEKANKTPPPQVPAPYRSPTRSPSGWTPRRLTEVLATTSSPTTAVALSPQEQRRAQLRPTVTATLQSNPDYNKLPEEAFQKAVEDAITTQIEEIDREAQNSPLQQQIRQRRETLNRLPELTAEELNTLHINMAEAYELFQKAYGRNPANDDPQLINSAQIALAQVKKQLISSLQKQDAILRTEFPKYISQNKQSIGAKGLASYLCQQMMNAGTLYSEILTYLALHNLRLTPSAVGVRLANQLTIHAESLLNSLRDNEFKITPEFERRYQLFKATLTSATSEISTIKNDFYSPDWEVVNAFSAFARVLANFANEYKSDSLLKKSEFASWVAQKVQPDFDAPPSVPLSFRSTAAKHRFLEKISRLLTGDRTKQEAFPNVPEIEIISYKGKSSANSGQNEDTPPSVITINP